MISLTNLGLVTQRESLGRAPELESAPSSNASIGRNVPNQNGLSAIHPASIIFNALNAQTRRLSGWQAGVPIQERFRLIFNM
jgi:hypothetical protein